MSCHVNISRLSRIMRDNARTEIWLRRPRISGQVVGLPFRRQLMGAKTELHSKFSRWPVKPPHSGPGCNSSPDTPSVCLTPSHHAHHIELFLTPPLLATPVKTSRTRSGLGRATSWVRPNHVNLRTTTRNWPFSVLGFWDKNTCNGAMSYCRDFPSTTRSTIRIKLLAELFNSKN